MTGYLNIYIILYVITLICLQYLIKTTFSNKITFSSIPYMIYYISKLSKLEYLYFGLFLALAGIPPFLLFYVKFNYLIKGLTKLSFISFYIMFLILFLNMLFYVQVFLTKNIEFDLKYLKLKKKKISYKMLYMINLNLTIFFLSVFFFPDLYIISTLLV